MNAPTYSGTSKVFDAMNRAGMLASTYLRVRMQLGRGHRKCSSHRLDMPEHDQEADRAENEVTIQVVAGIRTRMAGRGFGNTCVVAARRA